MARINEGALNLNQKQMVNIVYLNSDCAEDLTDSFRTLEWAKAIVNHPEAVAYSPSEFAASFNTEHISDYAFVVIVDSSTGEVLS